jgi:hypothetical protein
VGLVLNTIYFPGAYENIALDNDNLRLQLDFEAASVVVGTKALTPVAAKMEKQSTKS